MTFAAPIGPRVQRFATAAAPADLDGYGRPEHPCELLDHACRRSRFSSGTTPPRQFERDGQAVRTMDATGPPLVSVRAADLAVRGDCRHPPSLGVEYSPAPRLQLP
jgi:hypothetical protein